MPSTTLELCLEALALLDRDHAFVADRLHCFGDFGANFRVAVRRDGADLCDLVVRRDLLGLCLQLVDHGRNREVNAAPRSIGLAPAATDLAPSLMICMGQNSCGRRAVAGYFRRLGGHLLEHLRAHVLELVFEFDLLCDRHAILGNARRAIRFIDDNVATLGAECHLHCIGENVDTAQHPIARVLAEFNVFRSHFE